MIALDDADNSNPYCYVTKGPVRGAILYLCHDGESGVAFASLHDFLAASDSAIANGTWLDDIPHDDTLAGLDRKAVGDHVRGILGDEERVEELCVLLPLLDTTDVALMTALSDFFVREALAVMLVSHPNSNLQAICEQLACDRHPQVAGPGMRALAAVNRIRADS